MLPKENRLKRTKDIDNVFRRGSGYKEGFLLLKLTKNNLKASRFAFIASKKVSKKSSARNKIKRILRAQVAARLPNIKTGFDAAIVVLHGIKKEDQREIRQIIEKLFKRAKLI